MKSTLDPKSPQTQSAALTNSTATTFRVQPASGNTFTLASSGDDLVTGTAGADSLTDDAGKDTLNALGGNDTISFIGAAVINGGDGNDLITENPQAGGATPPAFAQGLAVINPGKGDDIINSPFLANKTLILNQGDGTDTLIAGKTATTVEFGAGITAASLRVEIGPIASASSGKPLPAFDPNAPRLTPVVVRYGTDKDMLRLYGPELKTTVNGAEGPTISSVANVTFKFKDGTTTTAQNLVEPKYVDDSLTVKGTDQNDVMGTGSATFFL